MTATWLTLGMLLIWGTVVGVDLVSFPQALLSRPLVASAGAGFLLGDPVSGFSVGVVLELFALDVLPVGAARYPDYGPAAVGAVVLAGGGPWMVTLGLATLYALLVAGLGGWSLQVLRRANGRALQRSAAGLAAGQSDTVSALLARGIAGDVLRSFTLTGIALALALQARQIVVPVAGAAACRRASGCRTPNRSRW